MPIYKHIIHDGCVSVLVFAKNGSLTHKKNSFMAPMHRLIRCGSKFRSFLVSAWLKCTPQRDYGCCAVGPAIKMVSLVCEMLYFFVWQT